jgi:hypothetical protein
MTQCLVFAGLGEGLGSGDGEGSWLGDDLLGVLLTAVGVVDAVAVRVGAPRGCR